MPIGSVIGPILGVGSALIGASSANKAAKAQTAAANQDIAFQRETRDQIRSDLAPFLGSGTNALSAYLYNMGLGGAPVIGGTAPEITTFQEPVALPQPPGPSVGLGLEDRENARLNGAARPTPQGATRYRVGDQTFGSMADAQAYADANKTGGTPYGGFQASPGYDFRFSEGVNAVNSLAGARGGLDSGRTREDLTRFGQGIAADEFNSHMSRLGGLIDTGVGAASMSGNASQNAATGVSNALAARGNAGAAGAIGVGNAIQGGINTGIGLWQYQNALAGPRNNNANVFSTPWAAPGFWG